MPEQQPTADQIELAGMTMNFCRGKDPAPTIAEIAEGVDSDEASIYTILDSFRVEGDKVVFRGPGQGGGWVPQPEPEELEAEFIGFRHPDGSIQETPFVPEEEPSEEEGRT